MKKTVILISVVVLMIGGLWFGRAPYRNYKQQRLLAQSRGFLAKSDYRNALLSARETLDVNPGNVAACRIIGDITERFNSPEAIIWRRQVIKLEPNVPQNRLDLARTALNLANYSEADEALRGIKGTGRNTVGFHTMSALLAVAEGRPALAEAHFAAAEIIDPKDKDLRFNRAVLDLLSTDRETVSTAESILKQLGADPKYHRDALRHLVTAAVRDGDFAKADDFSRQLLAEKPPVFEDSILRLTVLKQDGSAEFTPYLVSLENESAPDSPRINRLASWLLEHGMADEALQWMLSLPVKTQADQPVAAAIADCYASRGEWDRMQALLDGRNWGDLEFMRLALLARAYRGQKNEIAAQANWHAAVTAANDRLRPLSTLVRFANAWQWDKEKEDVAQRLIQRYPNERWVLEVLHRLYLATGNTRGLQKVAAALMEYDANDFIARNNFAANSLLLNQDLPRAHQIAFENYRRYPKDGVVASTYAYSLYIQGRTQEGLKALEQLPEATLEQPGVAAYYGILLSAAGQSAKAEKYLAIAERSSLLPEEKALVTAALNAHLSSR